MKTAARKAIAHSVSTVLDTSSPFGNDYRAVCACGWEGERHEVYDSAAEAREEAAEEGAEHAPTTPSWMNW